MTPILKKQLALLALGGALALGMTAGARQLRAQNERPKTAAEAAQLFGRLLAAYDPSVKPEDQNPDFQLSYSLISRANREKLRAGSFDVLLRELQIASKRPAFDVTSQNGAGETTVVEIAPAAKAAALPVVVVQEDGGFRVDLLATYARRMNIAEKELPAQLYQFKNIVVEDLPFIEDAGVKNRICQSNLKQIGLGILQYTQDYDEKFPRAQNWQGNLQPYLQNARLFQCPATKTNGYALNANLVEKITYDRGEKNQPAGIKNLNRSIAVYETSDLRESAIGTGKDLVFRHKQFESEPQPPGANFLFADGHAEFRFNSPNTRPDFALNPAPSNSK